MVEYGSYSWSRFLDVARRGSWDRLVMPMFADLMSRVYRAALSVYGAIQRRRESKPGVTVVIVNFQSLDLLRVTVHAIERFAPQAAVLVVDNNSSDGSRSWLKESPHRHLLLRSNLRHGPAMDLGFWAARTEYVIALDVDAFPISERFLPDLLEPLSDAEVCGASLDPYYAARNAKFVHACCLAMRRDRFIDRKHTFCPDQGRGADTAQQITMDETRVHFIEATSVRGPGAVGTVFGGIVYHNFYGTRFRGNDRERIDWVDRGAPEMAWSEAVARYLG
jgi:glycosyltransferase involved in cell wall biosynthesis